jgi:uncharacterized protein YlxW (UPF0749 family)
MDRKNILTESQIDDILKFLRKSGKGKEADEIQNNKRFQKKTLKLQKKVDDLNKTYKELERISGIKMKMRSIVDYI